MDTCKHGEEPGTVTLDEAVEISGVDRKRLAGLIYRDSLRLSDPRGCKVCGRVYLDSLPKRTADQPTVATDQPPVVPK